MNPLRPDGSHGSAVRSRELRNPPAVARTTPFASTADLIFEVIGTDRDVLLIGPAAVRLAVGLDHQRCRLAAVGCGSAPVDGCEVLASAGPSAELDLAAALGERTFDVIVATELYDFASDPTELVGQLRQWLRPGGLVVASQSEPTTSGSNSGRDPRPIGRRNLLALLETAGYAVIRYQPATLPVLDPSLARGPHGVHPLASTPGIHRVLVVAAPGGPGDQHDQSPAQQVLTQERDAAARQAADLTRELRTALARIESLAGDFDRSQRREAKLCDLLQMAQERIERGDEEFRLLAHRFQEDCQQQFEAREALEARLRQIRDSLPGKLFVLMRTLASLGRRRVVG